jgi:CBS domain-containing protein
MTHVPLVTCEESTDVSELVHVMTERKIDAVPVVRGLRLVGLVTTTDLLLLLLDSEEARPLPYDFRLIDDPRAFA